MLGVKDLAKHFALSERAIHRRLTVIGGLRLPGVELTGKGYRVADQGLAVLGRVLELERDGSTIEAAAKIVVEELKTSSNGDQHSADDRQEGDESVSNELVQTLREQIERQDDEIAFLREQLRSSQDQIQSMLPSETEGRRRLSRWAAIKAVFTGKA